jgi:quinol monooxygenase YgiN
MSVTAILEVTVKPDKLDEAPAIMAEVLKVTRAYDGNLSVVVTQDHAEPTHFLIVETWESLEHDAAYRAFRAGEESSPLAPLVAEAPKLTVALTREDI